MSSCLRGWFVLFRVSTPFPLRVFLSPRFLRPCRHRIHANGTSHLQQGHRADRRGALCGLPPCRARSAPFELLSYRDVRQRATLIADVTARRTMPPWKPDPAGPRFLDSRALTDDQIQVIQQWVKQGALEGDGRSHRCPRPRHWTRNGGSGRRISSSRCPGVPAGG